MKSNKDKIKKLLQYTHNSGKIYNGRHHTYGYHTLNIDGEILEGQRKPELRLTNVPYDFKGKNILDIGSNQGGMLFEISSKINYGLGLDFDPRLVNVANRISKHKNLNIDFYNLDLEKENFDIIHDFSRVDNFNVIFLLAVCMWIKPWKELISWVSNNCEYCLFETNGKDHQQQEQINFLNQKFKSVQILSEQSLDDPTQKKRKLLWCSK